MSGDKTEDILQLAEERGIVSSHDLVERNLPRRYLSRLVARGELERVGRGLYALPGRELTESHDLAIVARRLPDAVVCLLSALRFHDLTTQAPFEIWVALPHEVWEPRPDTVPLRVVRMTREALMEGVEEHTVGKVSVRVFDPAKTVADCFKFRGLVGLDVALEALREFRRRRFTRRPEEEMWTIDALWRYAGVCRVRNVLRPYLEAVEAEGG